MKCVGVILFVVFSIHAYTVHDLANKKYVLIQTDDAFTFNDTQFLYHVFDLDTLMKPYQTIMNDTSYRTTEREILFRRIEALYGQLKQRKIVRNKRAINFLGTALSWVTGVPDHDDMIEIKSTLNELIENNNQQRIINERFNSLLLETTESKRGASLVLHETVYKLQTILETINLAKNQQFFSQSIDLNDLNEIIKNEKNVEVPLLDIMEYATIHVCQLENKIIIIYKYPIITTRCKHFEIIPLAFMHGKLQLDNEIMKCGEQFVRTKNCKNNFRYNICQNELDDNCTTNILNDSPSTCDILQENNEKLQYPEDGYLLLDGTFEINNETVRGVNLIEFKHNITVDGKLYVNHKAELKQIIKAKHYNDIEINEILESESNNKFTNIQSMQKFIIPFERHPIRTTCYVILFILAFISLMFLVLKICKRYNEFKRQKGIRKQNELYLRALANRGIDFSATI